MCRDLNLLPLAMLAIVCGCGVTEYEQLVKSRQQELASSGGTGPTEWNTFASASGYAIEWPGVPEPVTDFQQDATTEELSGTAGSVSFRAYFLQSPNAQVEALYRQTQEQLTAQGYTVVNQSEERLNNLPYKQLQANDASGSQTTVRAYQLNPGAVCVLTVTSQDPEDPQIEQFLDSVRPL